VPQGNNAELVKVLGGPERYTEIMAKTTVDVVMSHEVPARRTKKEALAALPEDQQN
jgi:hypothetical protein